MTTTKKKQEPGRVGGHAAQGVKTHAEIAKILGVTRARVQQLEDQAMKKIRTAWIRMYPEDFQ